MKTLLNIMILAGICNASTVCENIAEDVKAMSTVDSAMQSVCVEYTDNIIFSINTIRRDSTNAYLQSKLSVPCDSILIHEMKVTRKDYLKFSDEVMDYTFKYTKCPHRLIMETILGFVKEDN